KQRCFDRPLHPNKQTISQADRLVREVPLPDLSRCSKRRAQVALPFYSITSSLRPGTRRSRNQTLWSIGSLALDVRCSDHLAPLLGIFDNEFGELSGRAYKWFRAQIDEPRFERGISKGGIHLLIEDRDDLWRRACGGSNTIPTARLVARQKLPDRRDIGQHVQTAEGP